MTKTDVLNTLTTKIGDYSAGPNDELTGFQQTDLCDQLAALLETVNPNHDYPPTNK